MKICLIKVAIKCPWDFEHPHPRRKFNHPQGHDEDEFQLRFGLLNIHEPDQTRSIDHVKKNPKYNKNNLDHDLALVKLDKPIELNENVIPAILPCNTSPP